jgi:Plasma-membrane choline transporter
VILSSSLKTFVKPFVLVLGAIRYFLGALKQSNPFVKIIVLLSVPITFPYDRFFRYVSKNVYIQVAIWSEGYYISAKKAYFLMHGRHKAMGVSMDNLQQLCVLQTKLCGALFSGVFVYAYVSLSPYSPLATNIEDLETPIAPAFYAVFLTYFFSSVDIFSLILSIFTAFPRYP